jgi:hypothetical protein
MEVGLGGARFMVDGCVLWKFREIPKHGGKITLLSGGLPKGYCVHVFSVNTENKRISIVIVCGERGAPAKGAVVLERVK